MNNEKMTPMMKQYLEIKSKHVEEILFFRLGDFYEMFFDDAIIASKELDIALTKRASTGSSTPMCGIPYHVAETYISRLISKGYKVAICDQVEDPKLAKNIVKREVTKIITPGTFTDQNYLKSDENNYLLSILLNKNNLYLSYVDFSTGELYTTSKTSISYQELVDFLIDEVFRINPSEIIINEIEDKRLLSLLKSNSRYVNILSDLDLSEDYTSFIDINLCNSLEKIKETNQVANIKSITNLISYLIKTQKSSIEHISDIIYYDSNNFLIVDENSKRNLELTKGINTNTKSQSLLEVLDFTNTSMGSRELKRWIEEPLINIKEIKNRQDIIESFCSDLATLDSVRSYLKNIYDIERLSFKISNKTISPRETISLLNSLKSVDNIINILKEDDRFKVLLKSLDSLKEVQNIIENAIIDDPPVNYEDNRFIKVSFSKDLDELFDASEKGREWILNLEKKEKDRTGIKNLKIKYNKILGYFIDVTKANVSMVPSDYIRKQTLVSSERYFSLELKDMESKILGSKEQSLSMQIAIFDNIRDFLKEKVVDIQNVAKKISVIDTLASLAYVALENKYVKPKLNIDGVIEIINGRHPIVERKITEELFVPNDTSLNNENELIHIITGPNMAGKSTYMRQVAIIVIMAHIGSFVPCDSANISIVDKIFTRIGASDNLAKGDSTFMVEMKEVANIIRKATSKSLIILDEVGRGTSTFDGLSIAWAIAEYISDTLKAKTLFATHYHELVELSKEHSNISNLTIEVEKKDDTIIFLRKIVNGFSSNSYGIDVAKLAGVNESIVNRANEILNTIDKSDINVKSDKSNLKKDFVQNNIFELSKNNLINNIKNIDINNISPIESLNLLNEIIKEAKNI